MNRFPSKISAAGLLRTYGQKSLPKGVYNYFGYELKVELGADEFTVVPPENELMDHDCLARKMLEKVVSTPSAWHFEADNVFSIPPFNCAVVAGRMMMNSIRRKEFLSRHYSDLGNGEFELKNPTGKINEINIPVILTDTAERNNYCHFITEVLPRIIYYGEKYENHFVVLSRSVPNSFRGIAADFVGEERILIVKDDEAYLFKQAVVCHSIAENVFSFSQVLDLAMDKVLSYCTPSVSKASRLYVSRADADFRRFNDEQFVRDRLRELSFVTVVNSDLTFLEQVSIFSQAKHVLGIHGAGLVNIIFSRELQKLTEFFPKRHQNMSAFWAIASKRNAKYARFLSTSENFDSHTVESKRDVSVDDTWFSTIL